MWLILLSTLPAIAFSDSSSCERIEYCRIPKVHPDKDCPEYGYDCSNVTEMNRFDLSTANGHSILKCKYESAKLLVRQESVEKLKCANGRWSYGYGETTHALCAKPCDSCSVEVPSFVSTPAISADVKGGKNRREPCAIAFCDGPGLRLLGVSEKTQTTTAISKGELRCTGDSWKDADGNTYDHAVCGYYNCPTINPMTSIQPNSAFGPPVPVNVTHGAATCGAGYQLVFDDYYVDMDNAHYTLHPLICNANSAWELLGVEIQKTPVEAACVQTCFTCNRKEAFPTLACTRNDRNCRGVELKTTIFSSSLSASCAESLTCDSVNYAPILNVGPSNVTDRSRCNANSVLSLNAGITVTSAACMKFSCKKDFADMPDINSLACPNRTLASCRRANVHSSRITCPCGWDLTYVTKENPTSVLVTRNLTCAASGSNTYLDPKVAFVNVAGASCRRFKQHCLRCRPIRQLFTVYEGVFETPATGRLQPMNAAIVDGCQTLKCPDTFQMFYDSLDTPTTNLTCGDDAQWHSSDGKVAHSAACYDSDAPCVQPEKIDPTDTLIAITSSEIQCTSPTAVLNYELDGSQVSLGAGAVINCVLQRYVIQGSQILPSGAKVGCSS